MKWLTKRTLTTAIVIAVLILISIYILPISIPLIIALITAIFLEPLVNFIQKRFKWRRKTSVISVFILFLVIVSALLYWTITQLVGQIIQFTKMVPEYINSLSAMWDEFQRFFFRSTRDMPVEVVSSFETELAGIMEEIRNWILTIVNYDTISNLLTGIPSFLVSFIVFLIALFLFMLDLPDLKVMLFNRLKDSTAEKVRFMFARLNKVIFGFLKAQFLVSCIIFIVSLAALAFIAPEYAIVMALLIWLIDFIPILGSIIVLTPWFAYEFITGDIVQGTQLAILALVLLIIRRTVEPKVMGTQIGLSPLATLIAMFIGLQLIGFLGFFVGPLIVILFTSAREAGMIKIDFKV
ncbi:sporulation integral membrane protein YtvI [Microbacterium sp. APC 3898]|uniref:Sporulation integral membrane protein YtvI n=1 Tax=Planococcus notacanthi TaxID=3035188 RepID=A0ABT7ZG49_9BACL|nr:MULTISPECIES: sporulation integral membrane protein YtvI [Terrabacteria group]MDN3426047.1 sporulation integral membrane protein YtvI [Planococcus sp. APC 4016]MDN3497744.1 sporulation integral membrane protein YtvI [Microbacterium sp. APC 3898]